MKRFHVFLSAILILLTLFSLSALAAPVVLPDDPFHGDVSTEEPEPNAVLGDVDGNGEVQVIDYIMVKRHVMRTYVLIGDQLDAADVDDDGRISANDYIVIKRIYMGTM